MAEIKKIATRESYGNALKELASEGADKLVVLDADLSAATFQLRYCRVKYDVRCRRAQHNGACSVRFKLRNVRRRQSI